MEDAFGFCFLNFDEVFSSEISVSSFHEQNILWHFLENHCPVHVPLILFSQAGHPWQLSSGCWFSLRMWSPSAYMRPWYKCLISAFIKETVGPAAPWKVPVAVLPHGWTLCLFWMLPSCWRWVSVPGTPGHSPVLSAYSKDPWGPEGIQDAEGSPPWLFHPSPRQPRIAPFAHNHIWGCSFLIQTELLFFSHLSGTPQF